MTDRPSLEPRGMRSRDVAAYLGLSTAGFYSKRAGLEAAGFPRADPLTRRFDRDAIDAWLDQRAGLDHSPTKEVRRAWIEAFPHGQSAAYTKEQ